MKNNDMKLFHELVQLSKAMKQFGVMLLYKYKVSNNEFYILHAAKRHSAVSIKEIKEDLYLTPASLSRVVSKMYDKQLIERSFSGNDKRLISVALTQKGEKLFDEIVENIVAIDQKIANKDDVTKIVCSIESTIQYLELLWREENVSLPEGVKQKNI